jgi:hypothetical protein
MIAATINGFGWILRMGLLIPKLTLQIGLSVWRKKIMARTVATKQSQSKEREQNSKERSRQPEQQPDPYSKIFSLQRMVGNRAVGQILGKGAVLQRKCACGEGCPHCQEELGIQTKLKISEPGDRYEQEADRVADQVMRMPEPKIQRVCAECEEELQRQPMEEEEEKKEEEETLQTKPLAESITPLIQRQTEPTEEEEKKKEEEETLQTKPASGEASTVSPTLQNQITALQGGGQPLPESERHFFEPRFGTDFSQVRIHADNQAAEAARAVNARAFTLGRDVVFGAEGYQPGASEGRRLLAHELTHTVQQMQLGYPTVQREEGQPLASPRQVATPARTQAANALDYAIERLNEAITLTERGDPIPQDVHDALARFFPGESSEFLPLLLRRIVGVRSIIETIRIRSVLTPVDAAIEPYEINIMLQNGTKISPWPSDDPTHILVFPPFYRDRHLQPSRLIHECFHIYYPSFIRHSQRAYGHENPRANAYSYQGFVSMLGGLSQVEPLNFFPEPEPMEEEEEEETLQPKTTSGQPPTISASLQNRITALQGGGQPLSESERNFFEPRFGTDFSQVRVHADGQAAEAARAVNARAFTLGQDVVFGAGEYQPRSAEGQRLMAHELTHVVQQKEGLSSAIQTFRITQAADVPSLAMREWREVGVPGKWNQLRQKLQQRDDRIAERLRLVSPSSSDHAILTRLQARWPTLRSQLSPTSGFDPAMGRLPQRANIDSARNDELADKSALTGTNNRIVRAVIQEFIDALNAYLADRDRLDAESTEYHRFDPLFIVRDVQTLLAAISHASFTTADVKALVDQETGDLLNYAIHGISRTTTGITRFRRLNRRGHWGLGQHSADARDEAITWARSKGVGIPRTPDPRTIPAQSIKLTAAYLGRVTDMLLCPQLPDPKPTGDELKKFIFAAYNTGHRNVINAVTSFLGGRSRSYLWNDIKSRLSAETRNYVSGIVTRLS